MRSTEATDPDFFHEALRMSGYWYKRSPEGRQSLMRALSNALYFTEIYHDEIQRKIIRFYISNHSYKGFQEYLKTVQSVRLFIENPSLPQFETLNLLIFAHMIRQRVKLYYSDSISLCSQILYSKTPQTLKIVRLFDNHYSALFRNSFEPAAAFIQNILLNIIDSLPGRPRRMLKDFNSGQYINFEFERWISASSLSIHDIQSNDQQAQPDETPAVEQSSKQDSSLANEILSLFRKRKQLSDFDQCISQIEDQYNDALKILVANNDLESPEDLIMLLMLSDERLSANDPSNRFIINGATIRDMPLDIFDTEASSVPLSGEDFSPEVSQREQKCQVLDAPGLQRFQLSRCSLSPDKTDIGEFESKRPEGSQFGKISLGHVRCRGSSEGFGSLMANKVSESITSPLDEEALNKKSSPLNGPPAAQHSQQEDNLQQEKLSLKDKVKKKLTKKDIEPFFTPPATDSVPMQGGGLIRSNRELGVVSNFEPQQRGQSIPRESMDQKIYQGTLKFFDEKNNFGFITTLFGDSWEDIFVYGTEFQKSGISLDYIQTAKFGNVINLRFNVAIYFGKYKQSKKATNIVLLFG